MKCRRCSSRSVHRRKSTNSSFEMMCVQFIFITTIILSSSLFKNAISMNLECHDNHQECPSVSENTNSKNVLGGDNDNICSIYLSPSSVPGAGMGIFAVKDFLEGDVILHLDGPNIPIIDPYHMPDAKKHWALFESYWWVRTHKSKGCFLTSYTFY